MTKITVYSEQIRKYIIHFISFTAFLAIQAPVTRTDLNIHDSAESAFFQTGIFLILLICVVYPGLSLLQKESGVSPSIT
jgi:hypothetical protein